MAAIDEIRNELIEKIKSVKNKELLEALDTIVSASAYETDIVKLTAAQKAMLEMSEEDIRAGNVISQEEMVKKNLEWLNAM